MQQEINIKNAVTSEKISTYKHMNRAAENSKQRDHCANKCKTNRIEVGLHQYRSLKHASE